MLLIKHQIESNDDELMELLISNINDGKQKCYERHELDEEHQN
jgi:hypothetical protein